MKRQKEEVLPKPAPPEVLSLTGRQILDYAREGIIVLDHELRFREWNPYLEELCGTPASEALGRHALEVFPQFEGTNTLEGALCALKGETVTSPDVWHTSAHNGREMCLSFRFGPLYNAEGDISGVICIVNDVTERKRTEEALRHSEARYRTLARATTQSVWSLREGEEEVEGLEWWMDFTGQTFDEIRNWGWLKAIHPEDRDRMRQTLEQALATRTAFSVVVRLRGVQGAYSYICVRGVPLLSMGKEPVEWIGTITDIHTQKEAEIALALSQQRFEDLVNTVDGIVWEVDPETFRFIFVSRQAERILGYPLEQWLEEADFWVSRIHPEDREQTVSYCLRATSELRDHDFEYRMQTAEGRYIWLHDVVSVYSENGKPVLLRGLMVNITEQRHLQEMLQQAQKMESIGRLAGGVAHDFNNLLTAILGYTELAEMRLPADHEAQRSLTMIRQASERATTLTNQLLTFARRQILSRQVVDLNLLITHVCGLLQRLINEDIELATLPAAGLWPVRVDAGQMEQVLINLVVNARDAMPGGGKLTIETANVTLDAEYARLHPGVKPGDYVQIAVSDTGTGMEEAVRQHIFEPFFTTKTVGKGTGLGLATCLGIVEQNEGHIWVYSEPGQGTTFKIYLPRVYENLPAALSIEPSSAPTGRETILVVEDEALVREIAVTVLRAQGYTTLEAETGTDALQVAEAFTSPIHLLLTDIIMPQMGGVELSERLLQLRPDIRVLYASGYTENTVVLNGILEKGLAFLPKPYSPGQLARKVRQTLDEK